MAFKAPYISKDELRRRAHEFLQEHNPAGTIPVPIEFIVEKHFGRDIVPMPRLEANFDMVAFLTRQLSRVPRQLLCRACPGSSGGIGKQI